jgi:16S rRNA (guanine1516-N2)-methyltransferase
MHVRTDAQPLTVTFDAGSEVQAENLARELALPLRRDGEGLEVVCALHVTGAGLELRGPGRTRGVGFDAAEFRRRLNQARGLAVVRATGARAGLEVLDAMAGFGLDGLTLAAQGSDVTMVESNAVMAALLKDVCRRARDIVDVSARVTVVQADAGQMLSSGAVWDVVYLDPMFPERNKQALPKLRMQLLRAVADPAPSETTLHELMQAALVCARERVVVKRRRTDAPVVGAAADWSITTRSVRFDVYRGHARAC